MNKKRSIFLVLIALAFLVGSVFVYSVYTETRFTIPARFGDLTSFVDSSALAYVEAPFAVTAVSELRKSKIGKTFLDGVLARDLVIGPVTDQIRFFSRRIQGLTGLDIGEEALNRLFSMPAAAVLYQVNSTNRAVVSIIKVRTSDSIVASLAGKLGAAVSGESGLSETKWKERSIFSLGTGRQALHFALVNDVLVISPVQDLVKLSIKSASLATTRDLPPDWSAFIKRHPTETGMLARVWLRREFIRNDLPMLGLFAPGAFRAAAVSLAFLVTPAPRIEASWSPYDNTTDPVLETAILGQLPSDTHLVLGDSGFFGGDTWRLSPLLSDLFQSMPEDNRNALEAFLKALPGGFGIVFDGFTGNANGTWPKARLVWNAGAQAQDAMQKLEAFVGSLPEAKIENGSHKGVPYRKLVGGATQRFDPCYARIGNLIVLSLDEPSMKSAIDLTKGAQKVLADSSILTSSLGKLRRENITHFSHIEAMRLVQNLYKEMGEHAFRSKDFSRREVSSALGPLASEGPGFSSLTIIAGRDQGYTRATISIR